MPCHPSCPDHHPNPERSTRAGHPGRLGGRARPGRHERVGGRDDGQTTVAAVLLVGVAVLLLVGTARLGAAAVHRAHARTAADAAALAGVAEEERGSGAGRRAAADIAARNGATLTGYRVDGTAVEATVELDGADASARAELVDAPDP